MSKESYVKRMLSEKSLKDQKLFNSTIAEAIEDMGEKIADIVNSYDKMDLPLIVATMNIISRSLENLLGKDGVTMARAVERETQSVLYIVDDKKHGGTE